jgi:cellulose synthase operon protein C
MSGDSPKFDDLDGLDWDAALDDWEKNTFVAEVAKDADSERAPEPLAATKEMPAGLASSVGPDTPMGGMPVEGDVTIAGGEIPAEFRGTRIVVQQPSTGLGQLFPKSKPIPFPDLGDEPTAKGLPAEPKGPPGTLLTPRERVHDPESDTEIFETRVTKSDSGKIKIELAEPPRSSPEPLRQLPSLMDDDDDDAPTRMVPSNRVPALPEDEAQTAVPSGVAPNEAPSDPVLLQRRISKRPKAPKPETPVGLDPASSIADRATWLLEEAALLQDAVERARALLAISEIVALAGDTSRALALAQEASDLHPQSLLAARQVRQLAALETDALAAALEHEAELAATPAARMHANLMAADVLRASGDEERAVAFWDVARKLDPSDPRPHIARAGAALARSDTTHSALRASEISELESIDEAIAEALRLRGIERPGQGDSAFPEADALRRAREAIAKGDISTAAASVHELAKHSEFSQGALWLSASLACLQVASRRQAVKWLTMLVQAKDPAAAMPLLYRALELFDGDAAELALAELSGRALDSSVGGILFGKPAESAPEGPVALVHALAGHAPSWPGHASAPFDGEDARNAALLARLLASNAEPEAIGKAAGAEGLVALQADAQLRAGHIEETFAALLAYSSEASSGIGTRLAAGLFAEAKGAMDLAKDAYAQAYDATSEAEPLLRLAIETDPSMDAVPLLCDQADTKGGAEGSVFRLEAAIRGEGLSEAARIELLAQAHNAAPELGLSAHLSERLARRAGDLDEVIRWVQERRQRAEDPLELAVESVREALLVADKAKEQATARLEEAHKAQPKDVALREMYDRLCDGGGKDRGAFWLDVAQAAPESNRGVLALEAAFAADTAEQVLAAARLEAPASPLGLAMQHRAELALGQTEREVEALMVAAKSESDSSARVRACSRLAELDALWKGDAASALTFHRMVLEDQRDNLASLRYVQQHTMETATPEEFASTLEALGKALVAVGDPEGAAHVQALLRLPVASAEHAESMREPLATLRKRENVPLWVLRAAEGIARNGRDDESLEEIFVALAERTTRGPEQATLLLRAGEAAARHGKTEAATAHLEAATSKDPGDMVAWGFLAEARSQATDLRRAAEACESLARTSSVPEHQLLAWYDAAELWLTEVKDSDRAIVAYEQCATIDVAFREVFGKLSALYSEKHMDGELASLLTRRLEVATSDDERVTLEVERARALLDMGDNAQARTALESALAKRPEHTTALFAFGDLCAKEGDHAAAEQAWVRLARLLPTKDEQRAIYERLAVLYSDQMVNLARAEVAWKEVIKRDAENTGPLEKLKDVYTKQNDAARAVEVQQQIVALVSDPEERLTRLIELAKIHENTGKDPRKAEQALEAARKEFPTQVRALKALADFYARQRQMPAMHILLDRAAADARRAFAAGRFVTSLFEILAMAFELRGKADAARVVSATLAAIDGRKVHLRGAEMRALDPRLGDLLAPELLSPALRSLLERSGDALDAAFPVDLKAMRATPLPPSSPLSAMIAAVGATMGMQGIAVYVSPQVGRACVPIASHPPAVLVGEGLLGVAHELGRAFMVVRALKLVQARASALTRTTPEDLPNVLGAFFAAFNPGWRPPFGTPAALTEIGRRFASVIPRNPDPQLGTLALEAAGMLGTQASSVGHSAMAWANRTALLAVGDPSAAAEALSWAVGENQLPPAGEERAAFVARTVEIRDLLAFSVSEAYAEARVNLGLDK